jgi:putative acetyltransferase
MKELEVRYTSSLDYKALMDMLEDKETISNFPFSSDEMKDAVNGWISFSRLNSSLTGVINGEIVSVATLFLMPYKKLTHIALFYIVVKKEYRKKGIGSSMLKNLINLAQNYFKLESIYIEVFEGSKIIKILKKFDFKNFAIQDMFVKENNTYKKRLLFDKWL